MHDNQKAKGGRVCITRAKKQLSDTIETNTPQLPLSLKILEKRDPRVSMEVGLLKILSRPQSAMSSVCSVAEQLTAWRFVCLLCYSFNSIAHLLPSFPSVVSRRVLRRVRRRSSLSSSLTQSASISRK